MSIDHDKLKKLIALVEENQLTELTIEEAGISITIRAEKKESPANFLLSQENAAEDAGYPFYEGIESEAIEKSPELIEKSNESYISITSPMVGIFYRCPSPDSPPYVEVGDIIEVGQSIGMIEAMKVFSEIPSEVAGRIVALPAENGKLVQQGDILAIIDVSFGETRDGGMS